MKNKSFIEEDLELIKSSKDNFLIAFYKEFRKINKKKKSIQLIEDLVKENKLINDEQKKLLDQKKIFENQYEFYSNIYELYKANKDKKVVENEKVISKEEDKSYVLIEKAPIEEQLNSGIKRLTNFLLIKYLISKENEIDLNPHPSATFIKDQKDINSLNHLFDLTNGFQGDKGISFPIEEERVMNLLKNIIIDSKTKIPNFETTFEELNKKINELASNHSFRSSTIIIHTKESNKQIDIGVHKSEIKQGEKINKEELKLDKNANSKLLPPTKELNSEIIKNNIEEIKEKNVQNSKSSGLSLYEDKKLKEKSSVNPPKEAMAKKDEDDEDDFNYVGKKENSFNIVKKGSSRFENAARGKGGNYKGKKTRIYRDTKNDE